MRGKDPFIDEITCPFCRMSGQAVPTRVRLTVCGKMGMASQLCLTARGGKA